MIIPKYWAESKTEQTLNGKRITVRRFGWSMSSEDEAQRNADSRVADASQRIVAGESLLRREPKHAYNGADGVPIREEIVAQEGESVLTRNAYGSICLNTPNVFFADIDFDERTSCSMTLWMIWALCAIALFCGKWAHSGILTIILLVLAVPFGNLLAWAINRSIVNSKGGSEQIAMDRIRAFINKHSNWGMRVYRTPFGLRTIATHQTFIPSDPAVTDCFNEIGADPRYVMMCERQVCFRARVSPKPWRIGMSGRLGGGVWPIPMHRMNERLDWVKQYEIASQDYAACRFIETLGTGAVHHDVRVVLELHDRLCRANTDLPIA